MFKVILVGLLLCLTPNVFAQEKQVQTPEQAAEAFMALSDTEKQSLLLDFISVKKTQEAKYLLDHWEKNAPEGNGPNDFLKSYILDLIKAQEQGQNAQESGVNANANLPKESVDDRHTVAKSLMVKGDMSGAQKLLLEIVETIPSDWKPIEETDDKIVGTFFNKDEFQSYVKFYEPKKNKEILWMGISYSSVFRDLAYIAIEHKDYKSALEYLDKSLSLEPDHIAAMQEKAFILVRQGLYQESYDLYLKSLNVREWASDKQRAQALRGAGGALIDLGKLDESEAMFKRSLEFEPGNAIALSELNYIQDLRTKSATSP